VWRDPDGFDAYGRGRDKLFTNVRCTFGAVIPNVALRASERQDVAEERLYDPFVKAAARRCYRP
jgi:hypothetical protein